MKYESSKLFWIVSDVKLEKNSRRMYRSLNPLPTGEAKFSDVLKEFLKIRRKYDYFYICNLKHLPADRANYESKLNFRFHILKKTVSQSPCTS